MPYLVLDPFRQPGQGQAAKLLGRFVISPIDPLAYSYAPDDPTPVIQKFLDEDNTILDGEGFVNGLTSSSLKAAVRRAITLDHSKEVKESVKLNSVRIQCRRLIRVEEAFDALMGDPVIAGEVEKIMTKRGAKRMYMVRGILTALDARFVTNDGTRQDTNVGAQAAVPEELAPVVGPAAGQKVAEVEWGQSQEQKSGLSGAMEGLRVFAVEYWTCKRQSPLSALRHDRSPGGLSAPRPMPVEQRHLALGSYDSRRMLVPEVRYSAPTPGSSGDGFERSNGEGGDKLGLDEGPGYQEGVDDELDDSKLVLDSMAEFESDMDEELVKLISWESISSENGTKAGN